jgi:hypothetical protein
MLSKVISISTKVNDLGLKSALIYTWMIPHCDDEGLITKDLRQLKALVVPMRDDISVKDIEKFLKEASELGLITIYDDCLEITGWFEHQSISESKMTKTRFKKGIPRISQEFPEFPKNSQPNISKDNISKDNISKDNISKESVEDTPAEKMRKFISKDKTTTEPLIEYFVEKGSNKTLLLKEFEKFIDYWTEKNKSGTKQRWELQETFDLKRRLSTWLDRVEGFNKKSKIINLDNL